MRATLGQLIPGSSPLQAALRTSVQVSRHEHAKHALVFVVLGVRGRQGGVHAVPSSLASRGEPSAATADLSFNHGGILRSRGLPPPHTPHARRTGFPGPSVQHEGRRRITAGGQLQVRAPVYWTAEPRTGSWTLCVPSGPQSEARARLAVFPDIAAAPPTWEVRKSAFPQASRKAVIKNASCRRTGV